MKRIFVFAATTAIAFHVSASSLLSGLKPHPRLFLDEAGFRDLKERIAEDDILKRCANHVKRAANSALAAKMPYHRITDGKRMLSISSRVNTMVVNLAFTYRVTGDRRYLEKAEALMCAAAEFKDWNPKHFLDTAVMSLGLAIGYDWLFDDLSPEGKATIRKGLVKNGIDASFRRPGVRRAVSNWGQVCSGGIAAAALAVAEDEPEKAEALLLDIKKHMPNSMKMYEPAGSYPEGPGYWSFGTGYNALLIAMLESAIGNDLGLTSREAFVKTGSYPDIVTGPSGFFFNYADCGWKRAPSWIVWWFARRFNTPGVVEPFEREALRELAYNPKAKRVSPFFILNYFPRKEGVSVDLPLAWRAGGTTDISIQRSSWDRDARFAGLKGGRANGPHGHMDVGSFVYDAKGVRWAWDIGSESYVAAEHAIKGGRFWHYVQDSPRFSVFRLSPAAHNTLMLDGCMHSATSDVRVVSITDGPLSVSTLDLTPLFTNATKVVRKGIMLEDGYRVADRVEGLRAGAPIKWTMMTKATVERSPSGLRLSYEGKTLDVTREAPEGTSDWMLDKDPKGADWESPNPGYTRITFTVPSDPSGTEFSVTLK